MKENNSFVITITNYTAGVEIQYAFTQMQLLII